jgi:hypothetical protein
LVDRVEELSATIDAASERQERLKALRRRKQFRNELTDTREELDKVRNRLDQGLPEKRAAIRDRHALTVRITPVTATIINYERGDIDVSVQYDSYSTTITCDYAVGAGILNQPTCERCQTVLDSKNPIVVPDTMIIGQQCCGEDVQSSSL